jgi:hypothetical protein
MNNTYQSAEPIKTVPYDNEYVVGSEDIDAIIPKGVYDKAVQKVNKRIWGKWQTFFPQGSSELLFEPTSPESTFDILFVIMSSVRPEIGNLSLSDVKRVLISLYESSISSLTRLASIWKEEGKKEFAKELKEGKTIESIIVMPTYYVTPTDIILLSDYYELPIMLYSATTLQLNNQSILKTMEAASYVYMKVPALQSGELPVYRIVVSKTGILIATDELSEDDRKAVKEAKPFDIESEFMVEIRVQKRRVRVVKPATKKVEPEQTEAASEEVLKPVPTVKPKIIKTKKRLVIANKE